MPRPSELLDSLCDWVRKCPGRIGRGLDNFCGCDLEHLGHEEEAFESIFVVIALLVTLTIGFNVSLWESRIIKTSIVNNEEQAPVVEFTRPYYPFAPVIAYVVLSFVVIGNLFGILRANVDDRVLQRVNRQRKYHRFGEATCWFARWTIKVWVPLVTIVALVGYLGLSPGATVGVRTSTFVPYAFKRDGTAGIKVYAQYAVMPQKGFDGDVAAKIRMNKDLSENWKIVGVDGYVGSVKPDDREELRTPMTSEPSLVPAEHGYSEVFLFGVRESQELTLVFRLVPRRDGLDRDTAIERFNRDKDAFRLE